MEHPVDQVLVGHDPRLVGGRDLAEVVVVDRGDRSSLDLRRGRQASRRRLHLARRCAACRRACRRRESRRLKGRSCSPSTTAGGVRLLRSHVGVAARPHITEEQRATLKKHCANETFLSYARKRFVRTVLFSVFKMRLRKRTDTRIQNGWLLGRKSEYILTY